MQLWRDRGADVVLPGELRVEFSMQKVSEGLIALQQLRSLALDVVVRADLKVPGLRTKANLKRPSKTSLGSISCAVITLQCRGSLMPRLCPVAPLILLAIH